MNNIQQQTAILFKCYEIVATVITTSSPGEMKKLTSKLNGFSWKIWEEHSPEIVYTAVYNRCSQNPVMKKYLISAGEKAIVEVSPYDKLWGIGISKEDPDILKKKTVGVRTCKGDTHKGKNTTKTTTYHLVKKPIALKE